MITPYLEQLIHEGKARYKSCCFAYGTLYNLPIQKEAYIIITDFDFYGFSDYGRSKVTYTKPDAICHLIRFESNSSVCDYVHRSDCILTTNRDTAVYNVGGSKVINCYQVHNSDVRILVLRIPLLHDVTFDSNIVPRGANEPANPRGVGGDSIVKSAHMLPGGTSVGYYFPNGSLFPTNPPLPGYKNTFTLDVNTESELLPATIPDQQSYPLFSVGYVEIFGTMPQNIKGSK